MRVLHVIPSLAATCGGPPKVLRQLVSALCSAGGEVDIATTEANWPASARIPTSSHERGVRIFSFPRRAEAWAWAPQLSEWLQEHAGDYDLIHVHFVFTHLDFAACRAAVRARVPYVVCPHGTLDRWVMWQKPWKKWPYYYAVERRLLRRAAAIHALSEMEARSIARLDLGVPIVIVPPVTALRATAPVSKAEDGPLTVVFLARIHPTKRLDVVLRALAVLRRRGVMIYLEIAGDGPRAWRRRAEKQVRRLGLQEAVTFHGWMLEDGVSEILGRSDLFALPSAHESFGLAVAEGLAAGLPVIISDQVALAADVQAAGAGRVVPVDDADAVADAIQSLCDRGMRTRMSESALRLARSRFRPEELREKLLRVYSAIVKNDAAFVAPPVRHGTVL
jgi:glycosyltransferase involved in cell wall biosynthesis